MSREREGASNIDATTAAARSMAEVPGAGKQHLISVVQHQKGGGVTPYPLQAQTGMRQIGGGGLSQPGGAGFQQHHIQAGRHVVQQQGSNTLYGNSNLMMMMSMNNINTATPCAACKLLRRRCAQECPFAPYFPPHEPQRFASVHKVYGASNVSKMLLEVQEVQRVDTANSLVYEANARLRDPIYGCMGLVSTLQQQARALQAELNAMKGELMHYGACQEQEVPMQHQLPQLSHSSGFTNPTMPTTPPHDHHPPISRGHNLPPTTLEADHSLGVTHSSMSAPLATLAHLAPATNNTNNKDHQIFWP